jgi:hypothetical protein
MGLEPECVMLLLFLLLICSFVVFVVAAELSYVY